MLLKPEVGSDICDICLISQTSTTGENTDDVPIPADDDCTRVSRARELVVLEAGHAVAEDGVLVGKLMGTIVSVVASDQL